MRVVKIERSWKIVLEDQFASVNMSNLSKFLRSEKATGKIIYPPGKDIFNAFELTPFERVKVVLLGQDPYHGPGQAHGLSFRYEKAYVRRHHSKIFIKNYLTILGYPSQNTATLSHGRDKVSCC